MVVFCISGVKLSFHKVVISRLKFGGNSAGGRLVVFYISTDPVYRTALIISQHRLCAITTIIITTIIMSITSIIVTTIISISTETQFIGWKYLIRVTSLLLCCC